MNKYKETFGVDISKDIFDVHARTCGHKSIKKMMKKTLFPFKNSSTRKICSYEGYRLLPL